MTVIILERIILIYYKVHLLLKVQKGSKNGRWLETASVDRSSFTELPFYQ